MQLSRWRRAGTRLSRSSYGSVRGGRLLRYAKARERARPGGRNSPATPGSARDFAVNVGDIVYFSTDSVDLSPEAQQTLANQARWLQQYAQYTITIEGHADERGTREYNIALGAKRAQAVRNFLAQHGINAQRIRTISYGKERPGGGVQRHLLLVAESPRADRAQQPPRSPVLAVPACIRLGPAQDGGQDGGLRPARCATKVWPQCRRSLAPHEALPSGEHAPMLLPNAVGRLGRGGCGVLAPAAGGVGRGAHATRCPLGAAAEFQTQVGDRVFFSDGSAELGTRARTGARGAGGVAQAQCHHPRDHRGPCRRCGASSHNLEVSRRRAEAVRRRLIESGVAPERIHTRRLWPGASDCRMRRTPAVRRRTGESSPWWVPPWPLRPRPGKAEQEPQRHGRQAVAAPTLLSGT